jgi:hypothetical protein
MLHVSNVKVFGLKDSLRASRYPMLKEHPDTLEKIEIKQDVVTSLGACAIGEGHDSFLCGIIVQFDVVYPQYWSMEFQRYHFADIISSSSKMHTLVSVLKNSDEMKQHFNKYVDEDIINRCADYAQKYNTATNPEDKYLYFMKTVSNLPMGYELFMRVTTNYRQLKTIYQQRKNHKLKEDWGAFCKFIEELPQFKELTGI